jgi:CheY-like chemotaxis protein
MLLTPGNQIAELSRCRDAGVSQYVIKPFKPSELFDTLVKHLCERDDGHVHRRSEDSSRSHAAASLKILLVEDSQVNQTVATRLLEKRGHRVVAASNGREAVEVLDRETFDVVLMDVQMPIMDGFAATAVIRERERGTGRHLTIIAMTAHAMHGDRERCLEAGMDGYVSKPVRPKELFDAIEDRDYSRPESSNGSLPTDTDIEVVDWNAALMRLNGDRVLLSELKDVLLAECPKLREAIRVSIEQHDSAALTLAAHTLKGAVGNFVAKPAFEAALRLETLARNGSFDDIESAHEAVEVELERLVPVLNAFEG